MSRTNEVGSLKNEFAHVTVFVDEGARGPRLGITDVRTGQTGYLDPLELETLAWSPHSDLEELMDPATRRWASALASSNGNEP